MLGQSDKQIVGKWWNMTEAKHTPGPWQIGHSAKGMNGTSLRIWRNDEGPDADEDSDNTNYACIAQHVHSEADAALIIAAPEMLASLKWLEPYAKVQIRNHPDATDAPQWEALIAAIAKATGAA